MQLPRLRQWRESRGLLQRELASESGLSEYTITRIESGDSIRPSTARKVADALGVSVADLIERPPVPLIDAPEEAGLPKEPVGMPHARITEIHSAPSEGEVTTAIEGVLEKAGASTRWAAVSDEEWAETLEKASGEEARDIDIEIENERKKTFDIRLSIFREGAQIEKRAQALMHKRYLLRGAAAARKTKDPQAIAKANAVLEEEKDLIPV